MCVYWFTRTGKANTKAAVSVCQSSGSDLVDTILAIVAQSLATLRCHDPPGVAPRANRENSHSSSHALNLSNMNRNGRRKGWVREIKTRKWLQNDEWNHKACQITKQPNECYKQQQQQQKQLKHWEKINMNRKPTNDSAATNPGIVAGQHIGLLSIAPQFRHLGEAIHCDDDDGQALIANIQLQHISQQVKKCVKNHSLSRLVTTKNQGWKSMLDFLVSSCSSRWLPIKSSRQFAHMNTSRYINKYM